MQLPYLGGLHVAIAFIVLTNVELLCILEQKFVEIFDDDDSLIQTSNCHHKPANNNSHWLADSVLNKRIVADCDDPGMNPGIESCNQFASPSIIRHRTARYLEYLNRTANTGLSPWHFHKCAPFSGRSALDLQVSDGEN